jgi:hypothetical protein
VPGPVTRHQDTQEADQQYGAHVQVAEEPTTATLFLSSRNVRPNHRSACSCRRQGYR